MNKLFLVMRHEFWRHVKRRGFLFTVFGFPLLLFLIFGAIFLFFSGKEDEWVGVVDHAGVLLTPTEFNASSLSETTVPFLAFADESTAATALADGDIQAYVVIDADYLASGQITLYEEGDAYEGIRGDLNTYLRASLLAEEGESKVLRFSRYPDVTFVSLAEESGRDNPIITFILPYLTGIIFIIAVFSTSGFLIQAVVDEKENRTMEILITSLRPEQLMIGKIIGLIGLGLVQMIVWAGFVIIGLLIARANITDFPSLDIPGRAILIVVAWFLPFYVMIASLMAAAGISVTAVGEAQQTVGIISILSSFPLYFIFLVIQNPNSPLSVTLSIVPFSSPLTILARSLVTDVPITQFALSWGLLLVTAVISVLLVSRLLRVGMLRYGQRLSLREVFSAVRQQS